ncbi:MAG: thioesterase family protein [Solirubrobacteraceae bacterium]
MAEAAAEAEPGEARLGGARARDRATAQPEARGPGPFERDTAVTRRGVSGAATVFDANVAAGWRAGRGPHGGYLAAMLLRALVETVGDPGRSPRSLTIHFARAPETGPVEIRTVLERRGRSLSTLSARMEQQGKLVALVLSAFSVPWAAEQIADLPLPDVEGASAEREAGTAVQFGAPPFTEHLVMQPRFNGAPLTGERRPMELGAWLGLAEARPIDALSLAFFSDALIPSPFMARSTPAAAPTVDLTVHFRTPMPRVEEPDPHELCFAQVSSKLVQDGFFEEDGVIWAADGTVLAQSRQLAILMPMIG